MQEQSEPPAFGKPLWLLWSWWKGDALPICSVVSGLTVAESKHAELLSNLMGLPEAAMREQLWLGHRAYLARLGTLSAGQRLERLLYWEDVSRYTSHQTAGTCMGLSPTPTGAVAESTHTCFKPSCGQRSRSTSGSFIC
jgi:hypothetical protein